MEVPIASVPAIISVLLSTQNSAVQGAQQPLFIGEMGVRGLDPATRASGLRGKLGGAFGAGVSGVLVWDWANAGQDPYSRYEVQPGDPSVSVLASAL
jgi:hypothetical protein